MKFCSLFSGSNGNCIYIGGDDADILIDAGVSGKKVETALASVGADPAKIRGILVTHEHSDHVAGVGVLARKYKIPVYATRGTANAIEAGKLIGKMKEIDMREVRAGERFTIGGLEIEPFNVSHDAAEPVAYSVSCGETKITVATDMGVVTEEVETHAKGSKLALIETNHDVSMLEMGPYPFELKQRILGNFGHLSNDSGAALIVTLAKSGTKKFFIGHMSGENNYPGLAYQTVACELTRAGFKVGEDVTVTIAERGVTGKVVEV